MAESEHHGDIAGEAGETFRHAAGSLTKGRDSLVFATVLIVLLSSAFMVAVTYMSWQALIERETSERISSEQIAFFLQNMKRPTRKMQAVGIGGVLGIILATVLVKNVPALEGLEAELGALITALFSWVAGYLTRERAG